MKPTLISDNSNYDAKLQREAFAEPARPGAAQATPLSPSQVTTYLDCAARWWFERIAPPTQNAALALGSAFHAAIAYHFERVLTHEPASPSDVLQAFSESFAESAADADFRADESPAELHAKGSEMVQAFLREAAPTLAPQAVELKATGMVGTANTRAVIDLVTTDGTIVDFKTASKKPTGVSSAQGLQLTSGVLLLAQQERIHTTHAEIITITKTKEPGIYHMPYEVTPAATQYAASMFSLVAESIEVGLHIPNRASTLCSRKMCAFWRQCQSEFGGHVKE